jgi:Tol biopolymer transport system component
VLVAEAGTTSIAAMVDLTPDDFSDVPAIVWAPDSSRLAFTDEWDALYVADLAGGIHTTGSLVTDAGLYPETLQFSPNSNGIVFERIDGSGKSLFFASLLVPSAPIQVNPAQSTLATSLIERSRWSPDGAFLAYAAETTGSLRVFVSPLTAAGPGAPIEVSPYGTSYAWSPKVLPP